MEQTAEDRYFAVRDAAIDRFTPERVPNIGQAELDAEGKARAELDRLIRAVLGSQSPEGFDAGQFNLTTLFSGDIDFGKLDGLVFEADGGDTRMVLSTRSMLMNWLQAKWQDPNDRLSPDVAMKSETFYLRAIGSDAAILRYADIGLSPATPSQSSPRARRTRRRLRLMRSSSPRSAATACSSRAPGSSHRSPLQPAPSRVRRRRRSSQNWSGPRSGRGRATPLRWNGQSGCATRSKPISGPVSPSTHRKRRASQTS
jgi:hypothetical protein